jgi:hypothetical protein
MPSDKKQLPLYIIPVSSQNGIDTPKKGNWKLAGIESFAVEDPACARHSKPTKMVI